MKPLTFLVFLLNRILGEAEVIFLENDPKNHEELFAEIIGLRARLEQAEQALRDMGKIKNDEARKHSEEKIVWGKERNSERARAGEMLQVEKNGRRHIEQKLGQTQDQLRYVSFRLLIAEEAERKRIAQEIHDGIGQHWATIRFRVENIVQQLDEQIGTALKDILPLIDLGLEETRRIQMNLRPPLLDDLGILATISWVCREFQKAHPDIHIETKINIQEDEVVSDLKTVVYRVMQEALGNIAEHSKGNHVKLSFVKKQDMIEFIIQDNGQGFDLNEEFSPKRIERGLGLAGMKERTQLSGGTFCIESAKGAGTTIRASWSVST